MDVGSYSACFKQQDWLIVPDYDVAFFCFLNLHKLQKNTAKFVYCSKIFKLVLEFFYYALRLFSNIWFFCNA